MASLTFAEGVAVAGLVFATIAVIFVVPYILVAFGFFPDSVLLIFTILAVDGHRSSSFFNFLLAIQCVLAIGERLNVAVEEPIAHEIVVAFERLLGVDRPENFNTLPSSIPDVTLCLHTTQLSYIAQLLLV
jgi:hypothetical protein